MSLRTSGTIDLFSWRGVWSHASTITAMCAKKGQKGIWVNIGTSPTQMMISYIAFDTDDIDCRAG